MAKQISLADGYSALILTNTQLYALRSLLNKHEVRGLLSSANRQIIDRVQDKINEQFGSDPLV